MIDLYLIVIILLVTIVMEMVDAGFGMGYGTVLTPFLLALEFSPLIIVPSVLISQAAGSLTGAFFHHLNKNADFKPLTTDLKRIYRGLKSKGFVYCFKAGFGNDLKIVFAITFLGSIATILAVFIAINIPKIYFNIYIAVLVLTIGLILLVKEKFKFSWKKMIGVGIIASFNKGLSGGGFGPVVTGGQIASGNNSKSSIACTTFSETPICIIGFLTYFFTVGINDYFLPILLSVGAIIGAPFGTYLTKILKENNLKKILGIIICILGLWILLRIFI